MNTWWILALPALGGLIWAVGVQVGVRVGRAIARDEAHLAAFLAECDRDRGVLESADAADDISADEWKQLLVEAQP